MIYNNVCLESIVGSVPEIIVSSRELEESVPHLYSTLGLSYGVLEEITGIRERRFWPEGTLPSVKSREVARVALNLAGFPPENIGALFHTSVWRDCLEPATACFLHKELRLNSTCFVCDLSNACVGFLSGLVHVANMIELGVIDSGLVVSTENGRDLVDTFIDDVREGRIQTDEDVRLSFASLTVGAASSAAVLTHRNNSRTGTLLSSAVWGIDSDAASFCIIGTDQAGTGNVAPRLRTNSPALMKAACRLAGCVFGRFLEETGWTRAEIDRSVGHQVSARARQLMLRTLNLSEKNDISTLPFLGNTVSAAVPVSFAFGLHQGLIRENQRVVLFGFGSGVNSTIIGIECKDVPRWSFIGV